MNGWRECKIADLCDITRGSSPRPIHDFISEEGTPWVKISDATESGSRYIEHTKEFIKPEGESHSRVVYPGDFILSNSATPGLPRFMKIRACIHDGWLLLRNLREVDELFLYYLLLVEREALLIQGNGSIFTNLKTEILKEHKVLLPPLPEQKAIAAVLSSLDDKIDLLHRQNKTLEAMAETLFRQWFVEPCKNGLPEGWEEKSLLSLIELVGGGTPKTAVAEYWNGDVPWLTGGDIAVNHKSFVLNAEKQITELGLNNCSTKILPKFATIISARGTVGKYCLLGRPMAFSQSNYGVLPRIPRCFFYVYLLINYVVEELQSSAYGSVFDTITTNTFRGITIPVPPETIILNFESQIGGYFNKVLLNKEQIIILEKLRDTLLPKLMSGEVRVEV